MAAGRLANSHSTTTSTTNSESATAAAVTPDRPPAKVSANSRSHRDTGVSAMSASMSAADPTDAARARLRSRWYRVALDSFMNRSHSEAQGLGLKAQGETGNSQRGPQP